jgi:DNA helicase-2/ATP-dependent DNA helicase PcrA
MINRVYCEANHSISSEWASKKITNTKKGRIEKDAFDRAKFYVALTRARYSAAIICDYSAIQLIDGVKKWKPE